MADKTVLFAGTDKGGFILTSDSSRRMWEVSGPFLRGYSIFHMTRPISAMDRSTWWQTTLFTVQE